MSCNDDTEEEKNEIINELKIDAHEKCKNYDIIEAIDVNFDGIQMTRKFKKMILPWRYLFRK
jgi:hypothetical protein